MRLFHTHDEIRRAELRTVAWLFAAMAIVTAIFLFIVGVHYLLGWW